MRLRRLLGSTHSAYAECVHESLLGQRQRGRQRQPLSAVFVCICLTSSAFVSSSLLLLRILKKSLTRFSPTPACVDHADEQRAGTILRLTESLLEARHDIQASVQP